MGVRRHRRYSTEFKLQLVEPVSGGRGTATGLAPARAKRRRTAIDRAPTPRARDAPARARRRPIRSLRKRQLPSCGADGGGTKRPHAHSASGCRRAKFFSRERYVLCLGGGGGLTSLDMG